jgi:hypothetical protein
MSIFFTQKSFGAQIHKRRGQLASARAAIYSFRIKWLQQPATPNQAQARKPSIQA